ncbi:MAG: serine/threonine-protein kinase, partial [Phycisphaeraceae bacterium]|nr:serine/threonine-protein kinase [Phycisphaeraceae bacterium]
MVAIKVLPQRLSQDAEFVKRFYAEGRAAGQLNHPNIVQPIDVGEAGDYHYYVMEYVQGQDAQELLEELVRCDEEEVIRIGRDIARALQHAHAAGLVHRDVKPENVMLTEDGTAKLADMGLARAVSDNELAEAEKGKAIGSPYYIAPEQIRGKSDIDFRADHYGLGATLYCLATGEVPFDAPTPKEVMRKHLLAPLKPAIEVNPTISEELDSVIRILLNKERDRRYETTDDLVADFEAMAMGEPPLKAQLKLDENLKFLEEEEAADEDDDLTDAPEPSDEPEEDEGPDLSAVGELPPEEKEKGTTYKREKKKSSITGQPLFWAAAVGWILALIFAGLHFFGG